MGTHQIKHLIKLFPLIIFSGCIHDAADPLSLSPSSPYATWSPLKGNTLISSCLCQTLVPQSFGKNEMNLAELIDIGLQNNPSTKKTWAEARAVAAQYGQSLSNFYPEINFASQYTRVKSTFVVFPPKVVSYTTTAGPDVTLSYTLFDFGQRSAAAIAAREALYHADWSHNQEIQTTIQTVMNDYYAYAYELKALKAKEADQANASASLDAANQRFALGLAALGDVAQARTQFLQSKINLTTQKQQVENAFALLAVDLGLPANVSFKVQPMPEQVDPNPLLESVDMLVAAAQAQRQDFLAAQADLRSKEASIVQAKRAVYPVLSTSLDFGKYWFQFGETEDYHWSAALNINFPLFHGFYYKNGVKQAEANYEQAKAALMQTELGIIQQVTTSHMQVQTAASNLRDSGEYLKAAELEFDIALSTYKAGTGTILDVLKAQSSLVDARAKKAGSERDWFTALASLSAATGSLCVSAPQPIEEKKL